MRTLKNTEKKSACLNVRMSKIKRMSIKAGVRIARLAITRARFCTRLKTETCKKVSRCAADCTSKTTFFISHFLTKILRKKSCVFVISLVQWWKLYYIYIFFTQRTTDFDKLKRNMNDGTIVFLTSLLSVLTWKILLLFSFWYKIISCFK